MRVSAGFKGRLIRVFSDPFSLAVSSPVVPVVSITAPKNLAYVNASPITVSGTVSDASATVKVNGVGAPVSSGRFTLALPLLEGPNTITASAQSGQGPAATASVQVTLDTTPPRLVIDSPADGYITSEESVTVTGKANDIVVGTVNNGRRRSA